MPSAHARRAAAPRTASPRAAALAHPLRALRTAAAVAALAAVPPLLAGCGVPARADDGAHAATDAGSAAPRAVPVAVALADSVTLPVEVRAGGVLAPRTEAELAFQVPGRVARVAVDEGDRVAAGATLAALEPTDYALALRQAELQAERTGDERRRARALLDAGALAPNGWERADVGARQAAVGRDLAAKRLRDATLAAPFAGTVAAKRTEVGALVAPGAPAFVLVDLAEVRVKVGVAESDVGALRAGQAATVALPALGRSVAGRVERVGVAADPASRTYTVTVAAPNADGALRAGMVASVAIATGASRAAVAVPASAVGRDAEGATQLLVHDAAAGLARARRVTVGAPLPDGRVVITDGVAAGEPVIVSGGERARDGARVRAVAPAASPADARTPHVAREVTP